MEDDRLGPERAEEVLGVLGGRGGVKQDDAGVAAGLCINVLQPDMTNLGGVAPIMLYSARERAVRAISGLGWWPQAVEPDYFVREYFALAHGRY